MEQEPEGLQVRVGVFFAAAVVLIVAFALALGHVRLRPGLALYADFAYAGGLQAHAPVKLGGIEVGQVQAVALLPAAPEPAAAAPVAALGRSQTPLVRAQLALDAAAEGHLGPGTTFAMATQGVIGESYLELLPGGPGGRLAEGAAVRGVDAPRLHVMALQLGSILATLGAVLGEDPATSGELGHALAGLMGTLNAVLAERREELSAAIGNAAAASADLKALAAGLHRAVGDGQVLRTLLDEGQSSVATLQRELPAMMAQGKAVLAALDGLARKADGSLDQAAVARLFVQAQEAMDRLGHLSSDAEAITRGLRQGQGTVGGLVTDSQIYDDLKELLRDLKRHPYKFLWRD